MCACYVASVMSTLCDPMDYSLPGSSVHGNFQARILERESESRSVVSNSFQPHGLSMDFSRLEYWSG